MARETFPSATDCRRQQRVDLLTSASVPVDEIEGHGGTLPLSDRLACVITRSCGASPALPVSSCAGSNPAPATS